MPARVRWHLKTLFLFRIRCTVGCDIPYFRDKRLCETPTLPFTLDSNFFVVALVNLIGRPLFSLFSGFLPSTQSFKTPNIVQRDYWLVLENVQNSITGQSSE